jgi:hypothetical protein
LNEHLNKIEKGSLKPIPAEDAKQEAVALAQGPGAGGALENDSEKALVDVKNWEFRKEGAKLTVRFDITNADQNERLLRGYVHVIAVDQDSEPPQLWTFPKVALREGVPINYRRGQLFIIKRFRKIEGEYFFDSASDSPSLLRVLVYSQSGQLILTKEFEIQNAT